MLCLGHRVAVIPVVVVPVTGGHRGGHRRGYGGGGGCNTCG